MQVLLNSPGYSYDVHSLVKAFYPNEDVKVDAYEGILPEGFEGIEVYCSSGDVPKEGFYSGDIRCSFFGTNENLTNTKSFENKDRAFIKSIVKIAIYELLSKALGITLPWGTLTGIRPTKIPMKMIEDGKSDEEIREYLKSEYLCSDEKIELATDIAHRENELLSSISRDKGYSLYIGIPFCPTTCLYCSFTSYPIVSWAKRTGEYIAAVKKEIDYVAEAFKDKRLDSVYIGGGTPTTLEADELYELITYVKESLDISYIKEFTVEAGRPDSITRQKLETLKELGVTRLSINPQTMNDKTLKVIGRRHTIDEFRQAYALAREVGFDNINMDLILGLPGEDEDDVKYSFDEVKKLAPDSLTVHSMAIKRAAGMHDFLSQHEEYKSVNTPHMMEIADECARQLGMDPYYLYRQKNMSGNFENVGYAQKGKYGVYNILIMEEVQTIIACGAGTVTKRVYGDGRIERCDNVKDVALYIDKIDEMIERKRNLFSTIEC